MIWAGDGGPADGVTSTDIGVSQNGTGPLGGSIDRTDIVPGGYTWVSNNDNTKGARIRAWSSMASPSPSPKAQPVTADCGTGPLSVLQGTAGSRTVTATDPDGTVSLAGDHQLGGDRHHHRRHHARRRRRRNRQRHRLGRRHHGAGHLPGRDHGQQ